VPPFDLISKSVEAKHAARLCKGTEADKCKFAHTQVRFFYLKSTHFVLNDKLGAGVGRENNR
jgi:hypothetical protein